MRDSANREVEYEQTIQYIQHMYDTRHHIFQFVVAINTGLLTVVFQFLQRDVTKIIMCLLGALVTVALTLMARRSLRFLQEVEHYAKELEEVLGFGLIQKTAERMPKGNNSSAYLFVVCWSFVATWTILSAYYVLRATGVPVPTP